MKLFLVDLKESHKMSMMHIDYHFQLQRPCSITSFEPRIQEAVYIMPLQFSN